MALSLPEKLVFLRSLILLPVASGLLWSLGLRGTAKLLGCFSVSDVRAAAALSPARIAWLVGAAASIWGSRCLARSIVLCRFLSRMGVPVQLRLGVSLPGGGDFLAHAWVESEGAAVNERVDVIERYSSAGFLADFRTLPARSR